MELISQKTWQVTWRCRKWHDSADHTAGKPCDAVVEVQDNLLLNAGINLLLHLLAGASGAYAYNAANTFIKGGDGSAAAVATQTDLQGSNTASVGMDPGFPSISSQTITWQATFNQSTGNFTWNEIGVVNGAGAVSPSIIMLNRKAGVGLGAKSTNNTWQISVAITIT